MTRLIPLFYGLLLPILLVATTATAQEVEVSVDREELARGETLTFTIRVYDQRQGMQLDLTPLTEEFDVLGTRTSSQIRSINGAVESWTDYIVTLFPLTEGELTIPSIEVNNVETDPIVVSVVNEGPRSNQDNDELFLEIEVNKDTVYVQEQLLFTVRLYYTINGIRNPQFTELEMEDTVIQLIGSPNQYEQIIEEERNGSIDQVRYGVYEKRYVIFPQRSGPLEIPDILFRGEVTDGSSNFVFRNLNTRRVTAFIDGITINVEPRPNAVRDSSFWLPVSNLTLEEEFSSDITNLRVGDSIVRTITMVTDGLDGAVLPPFSPEQIDGLNVYPDPPDIQRTFVDGSIVGTRVETTTLVPTRAGDIEIPQVTIEWWNVNTDELESTIIPATSIEIATIEGDLPSEQTVVTSENIEDLLAAAPVVDQDMIDAQAEAEFIEVDTSWLNYFIALAFLIVAYSIFKLVIVPNSAEINAFISRKRENFQSKYSPENNEWIAFNQLRSAGNTGDLNSIREKLIQWSDHFINSRTILTMEDILQQRESTELHQFVEQIQAALFNNSSEDTGCEPFNPAELIKAVSLLRRNKLRNDKIDARQQRYALPPLYKT
ncbi:MAG: BatD family protein [Gammaproteobacteria bacterium]|nr:BatD family protein [Gammaproteobacteria bacterium]MDD9896237.1 BatD family protein [Gammaproteobacteria bacterium]MDD9958224.1 BatD family protein [Gammaproteobacteria bacterium]